MKTMILVRFVITTVLLVCTVSAEIIPAERRIIWDPGVRGGIPNRTTIATNLPTSVTTAAFQAHLNAASATSNRVVQLTNGTYTLTDLLVIPTGVTLRGNGISNTIIVPGSGFGPDRIMDFDNGFDDSWGAPARNITAGNTKGSTNLTTSVAHGWAAGDMVLIDMLEQPSGDPPVDAHGSLGACNWCGRGGSGARPIGQLVTILTTPTTTTCTFDPPLYWSYANTPQGVEMTGLTKFAGIENLSIDNRSEAVRDQIGWFGAVNCWTKNVEQRGVQRRSDWIYTALWWEKTGCIIHEGIPVGTDFTGAYTSDRSYGPFLGICSAGLLTDSILSKLTMGWAVEGPAAGNVQAYNFVTNIWWESTGGDSPRRFGPLMHGPHPFMNLVEGNNSAGRLRADAYWGTSSHWTILRNRIVQIDRGTGDAQTWTVDIENGNWYYSLVGNVLGGGASVSENNYEYAVPETSPYDEANSTIYRLGYNTITEDTAGDTNVARTLIRWGNWSFRTNDSTAGSGQLFFPTNGVADTNDHVIPNSYYLSSAPSFFSNGSGGRSTIWPPYDPSNPTMSLTNKLPAQHRYEGFTNYQLVAAAAPLITSSTNQIATNYQTFSYQITTDVSVDNYGATNLPSGLTVGNTTGLIQGTISIANTTVTNDVGLFATNSTGSGQTNMALKIVALAAPVIDSPTTADGTNGVAFTYQITGTQYPTNFGASGLPTGLSASLTTGLISGTPSQDGTFMVTLAATNGIGSDTETLTLEIDPPAPVLQFTPSLVSFSEMPETRTNTFLVGITNLGGVSSLLTGGVHAVSSPFSFVAPTNFSLVGGTGTNVTLRYLPTSKGTNTSALIAQSNAGNATNNAIGVAYPLATNWVDIPLTNALINQPFFVHSGNYIFQTNQTALIDGGRAVYGFVATNAGDYTFACKTESADLASDSMFFQVDGEPTDPENNWPWGGPTSFSTNKIVFWFPETVIHVFPLQAGDHKVVFRGREGQAHLRAFTVFGPSVPVSIPSLRAVGATVSQGTTTSQQ